MRCPTCQAPIIRSEEENIKNFRCSNKADCPTIKEARYSLNVSVKEGWWFAESYHIPFKWNGYWFCAIGPDYHLIDRGIADLDVVGPFTMFQKIKTSYKNGITNWNNGDPIYGQVLECSQEDAWYTPYMALPVNQDFNREFDILLKKFDRYINKLIVLQ
jgi:hypothetical protein